MLWGGKRVRESYVKSLVRGSEFTFSSMGAWKPSRI